MSILFSPYALAGLHLENRIVVPPMCQYSAEDGLPNSWHFAHYANLALSGAGMLIIEATAVEPKGRISPADLGLWSDKAVPLFAGIVEFVRTQSKAAPVLQLAHAGRKASTAEPWKGGATLGPEQGGWTPLAPSPLAFVAEDKAPCELEGKDIARIREAFAQAAKRGQAAGFAALELHAAHGYLLHEFLSPLSNKRCDEYGGSLDNRLRLVLETFTAMREATAGELPLGIRISGSDWVEGGWDAEQSIELISRLKALGLCYVHVSSGGLSLEQRIPLGPGYQVPLAARIKAATGVPTIAVGLITEARQAEEILAKNQADLVALGRAMLYDPRWPWHAAAALDEKISPAPQYLRAAPHEHKNLFKAPE